MAPCTHSATKNSDDQLAENMLQRSVVPVSSSTIFTKPCRCSSGALLVRGEAHPSGAGRTCPLLIQ